MKNLTLFLLVISIFVASCEVYPQDDYEESYVVESYLVGNRQLSPVRLSTTLPALDLYSFEEAAISNANVEVRLLATGSGSAVEQTFTYSNTDIGIYEADQPHQVLPLRTYQLYISMPGSGDIITAETLVPQDFVIQEGVRDTVIYQSSEQLEITISASSYPGRQNIFVFNTLSQAPLVDNLTPLYREFYDSDDTEEDILDDFANNSSGIINEGNFDLHPDGSVTLTYPWLGIAFYEETLVVVNTLDDNIYDFVRSQSVQLNGSTLSPGEIQNVISHVKGGVGIFGSVASDTVATYIQRNPLLIN